MIRSLRIHFNLTFSHSFLNSDEWLGSAVLYVIQNSTGKLLLLFSRYLSHSRKFHYKDHDLEIGDDDFDDDLIPE